MRHAFLVALLCACASDTTFDSVDDFAPEASEGLADRTTQSLRMSGSLTPIPGTTAVYQVTGVPAGATVNLWGSTNLVSPGVVFGRQGLYLAIAAPTLFRLTAVADATGTATFSVPIPAGAPIGSRIEIQAFSGSGSNWFTTPSAVIRVTAPACGDGILTAPEACDDGNILPGDGCDALCQIEPVGCVPGAGTLLWDEATDGELGSDENFPQFIADLSPGTWVLCGEVDPYSDTVSFGLPGVNIASADLLVDGYVSFGQDGLARFFDPAPFAFWDSILIVQDGAFTLDTTAFAGEPDVGFTVASVGPFGAAYHWQLTLVVP